MTFESHRNRISILKSGRRALESRSATTFATRWHREKGRIAAFEFFFFGCLELRDFKYFEKVHMNIYVRKVASVGINHHVEHCIFVPASRVLFSSRCPTFRVSLLSSFRRLRRTMQQKSVGRLFSNNPGARYGEW